MRKGALHKVNAELVGDDAQRLNVLLEAQKIVQREREREKERERKREREKEREREREKERERKREKERDCVQNQDIKHIQIQLRNAETHVICHTYNIKIQCKNSKTLNRKVPEIRPFSPPPPL